MSKYEKAAQFKENLPSLQHRLYQLKKHARFHESPRDDGTRLRHPNKDTTVLDISVCSSPIYLDENSANYIMAALRDMWPKVCQEASKIAKKEFDQLLLDAKAEVEEIQNQIKEAEKNQAEGDGRKVRP
jgi:hypothetical protein